MLVTNRAALQAKYGVAGVKAIEKAVKALATVDAKRGLDTKLIYLDSAVLGSARVTDPADPAENKAAVDAVAKKHRPEYLAILGAPDVVPYQDLKNKLFDPADPDADPDRFAGSDLPYACEAPYSQDVTKFLGPTRVVGRIPDLRGAATPAYLISRLKASAAARPQPRPESCFALSVKLWVKSTKMSVRNILGAVPVVLTSPTAGPAFKKALLREKVHFVNCHGNESDHTFAGESPKDVYFTAMDARKLEGVSKGTVAAFECCFGAELYDPAGLPAMSIANTYLAKGAAGVVASTTISYGPFDDNANADVICQIFIEQLLRGASLGRAMLEARLAYVRQQSVVDPYDEKTLAQFVLLGDPSLHPFIAEGDAEDADDGGGQGGGPCRPAAAPGPADEGRRTAVARDRLHRAGQVAAQDHGHAAQQGVAPACAGGSRTCGCSGSTSPPAAKRGVGQGAEDDAQGRAGVRGHPAAQDAGHRPEDAAADRRPAGLPGERSAGGVPTGEPLAPVAEPAGRGSRRTIASCVCRGESRSARSAAPPRARAGTRRSSSPRTASACSCAATTARPCATRPSSRWPGRTWWPTGSVAIACSSPRRWSPPARAYGTFAGKIAFSFWWKSEAKALKPSLAGCSSLCHDAGGRRQRALAVDERHLGVRRLERC